MSTIHSQACSLPRTTYTFAAFRLDRPVQTRLHPRLVRSLSPKVSSHPRFLTEAQRPPAWSHARTAVCTSLSLGTPRHRSCVGEQRWQTPAVESKAGFPNRPAAQQVSQSTTWLPRRTQVFTSIIFWSCPEAPFQPIALAKPPH